MGAKKIVVISAGLGTPSSSRLLADQLADASVRRAAELGIETQVAVYELRDLAVDIANNFVTGYAAPRLAEAIEATEKADALVAVSPVFSASYSGLFKSFIDLLDHTALEGKPVLLGVTGGSERHSMVIDFAMRPLFSYLRAKIVPTAVFAAPMDWGQGPEGDSTLGGSLTSRIERAAAELVAELAEGTPAKAPRVATRPEDKSFEELLSDLTGRN
ncbi:FMN reductase [Sinomonas humi]|uniref:NADPH-dependent FMN reductase n=1 Tax=Sinomonas humi TaxID=1338436 RepID=A0A0B2AR19_9MICC|nr:FMN reductase [Sinomonas humi]KHL04419.1 NADPH-dependent FMN reductase [Sinomonas humi]